MYISKITLTFILSTQIYADSIGSLLFHGNCVTCHDKTKSISAPSMAEVRKNYLNAFSKKEDFVAYMSTWVKKPNASKSIMLDAIDRYSLMPELAFEKETLEEIAEYIYETKFQ